MGNHNVWDLIKPWPVYVYCRIDTIVRVLLDRIGGGVNHVYPVVLVFWHREQGDLLHDIPAHDNWDGLCEQANNRKRWRQLVAALKQDQCTQKSPRLRIEISDKVPGWAPQRCFKDATTIFDQTKGKNDNDLTNTPRSRAVKRYRDRDAHHSVLTSWGCRCGMIWGHWWRQDIRMSINN